MLVKGTADEAPKNYKEISHKNTLCIFYDIFKEWRESQKPRYVLSDYQKNNPIILLRW